MIFSWKREELLLLNGVYGIIIGVYHTMFSKNFERFSSIIHLGQLDSVLIKPIDSQFLLTFWLFGYASLSRIVIAFTYTAYIIRQLQISVSFIQIIYFFILMIFSLLLLYSIWFLVLTFTIWFTRLNNLVDLMFTITGSARYPQEMFRELTIYVFFFLFPLTLIMNIPTKLLIHRLQSTEILTFMVVALTLFIVSKKFWKFALRYYTSASS